MYTSSSIVFVIVPFLVAH
uniref:Uncharacterized protein n=1 Tax=Arundo donax TaxID=35708 RepID=A0A0A9B117_ARUDO